MHRSPGEQIRGRNCQTARKPLSSVCIFIERSGDRILFDTPAIATDQLAKIIGGDTVAA